jgi:ABC-type polar amino acid transport system ATPase subunit
VGQALASQDRDRALKTQVDSNSEKKMIEIKNVSKWYGPVQVLNDCSVNIKKGDVVVVCGPSGSGKSTLIKTVNALEPVQQGSIHVDGVSITDGCIGWSETETLLLESFEQLG